MGKSAEKTLFLKIRLCQFQAKMPKSHAYVPLNLLPPLRSYKSINQIIERNNLTDHTHGVGDKAQKIL